MSKRQRNVLKRLAMFVIAAILVFTTVTPAFAKAEAKAPKLNAANVTIVVGKTFNFNVSNKLKGFAYQWSVTNDEVAVINEANGVVTGVGKGTTNIFCRVITPGKSYRLNAKVTVLKPAVKVEITNPVTTLNVSDYYILRTELTPKSSNDIVSWTSSDKSIAKVDPDGSFAALKEGTVTITATTVSGRSDSVTIKVLKEGETAEGAEEPEEGATEEDADGTEGPAVVKTVYSEDFASSAGGFVGRGSATVTQTTAGMAAEGGKGYLSVTGRTANWNGAAIDLTSLVIPGATYLVTVWVRYTKGADTEVIKITQERTSKDENKWVGVTGDVIVEKNKWTKISGTMEVSPSTTLCTMYFEANNLIDFFVDNVVIEQLDTEIKEEEVVEVEKAKVGDIVYQNDFEDGSILDSRGSSERTNTTAYAKSGSASVEVKRTAGWDGAGVRFTSANKIEIASLYGMTVHTSIYVMYKDGPDQVNFKLNNRMEKADNSDNILSQVAVNKGEWTLLEADCYIADNATGNIIFIETEGSDALTFYMDDIEIKVVK